MRSRLRETKAQMKKNTKERLVWFGSSFARKGAAQRERRAAPRGLDPPTSATAAVDAPPSPLHPSSLPARALLGQPTRNKSCLRVRSSSFIALSQLNPGCFLARGPRDKPKKKEQGDDKREPPLRPQAWRGAAARGRQEVATASRPPTAGARLLSWSLAPWQQQRSGRRRRGRRRRRPRHHHHHHHHHLQHQQPPFRRPSRPTCCSKAWAGPCLRGPRKSSAKSCCNATSETTRPCPCLTAGQRRRRR